MRSLRLPNTLVIIFSIIILVAVLTWFFPGGQYDRIVVNGREVLDPNSYQTVDNVPQGLGAILQAPIRGFIGAANIIAFVLIVGGAFTIIQKTGAIDALINGIARAHERSRLVRGLIIPLTMMIFSAFGSIFGMSEEVIPFILVFVPLAISLGYDSIVGVAIPFVGAGAGFAGAILNPFTVGIAQGIAELPVSSGINYRIFVWLLLTAICITFVMLYGRRIRRNPQKSVMHKLDAYWRRHVEDQDQQNDATGMDRQHIVILSIFAGAMIFLPIGVKFFGWYINEISALFFGIALIIGLVSHLTINELAVSFVDGAKEFMNVAFIIAFAKAIVILAADGRIIDSILHGLSGLVSGAHPVFAAQLMFAVQSVINVFIPSGSGQAALIMPIMAPLSDILQVTRQTAVLAFQLGDGLTNMIIPTSGVTMGVLGVARIPYEKWFGWMLPLQIVLFVLALLLLIPPVLMHWGPF